MRAFDTVPLTWLTELVDSHTLVGALWLALLIDHWLGEPAVRWHPVVWMGNYLGWIGKRIAPSVCVVHDDANTMATGPLYRLWPFIAGSFAWGSGATVVLIASIVLQRIALGLPTWAAALMLALLLKPMLAWRMLRTEVLAVEVALAVSLDAGRARLTHLVSRDVSQLTDIEVREGAIESLAENLNDSVVAPLFWFVMFGLPGAALYRFANTADAMWGYLGERNGRDWTWAGKWAARADDLMSWVPARLTAGLLILSFSLSHLRKVNGVRSVSLTMLRREAARTPSPNSGWPMAAMALLLKVRLGKPGAYTLNSTGLALLSKDMECAVVLANRSVVMFAALIALLIESTRYSNQFVSFGYNS